MFLEAKDGVIDELKGHFLCIFKGLKNQARANKSHCSWTLYQKLFQEAMVYLGKIPLTNLRFDE